MRRTQGMAHLSSISRVSSSGAPHPNLRSTPQHAQQERDQCCCSPHRPAPCSPSPDPPTSSDKGKPEGRRDLITGRGLEGSKGQGPAEGACVKLVLASSPTGCPLSLAPPTTGPHDLGPQSFGAISPSKNRTMHMPRGFHLAHVQRKAADTPLCGPRLGNL